MAHVGRTVLTCISETTMFPLSLALGVGWLGVAAAQEAPDTAESPGTDVPESTDPSPEPSPAPAPAAPPDFDAEIAAFLGEEAAEAPPPPASPRSINALNPSITAFGDVLAGGLIEGGELSPSSTAWLRSFEMDVRADVDPFAKAVAVIAIEQEGLEAFGHDDHDDHDHDHEDEHDEEAEAVEEEEDEHGAHGVEVAAEEVYIDLVALPAHLSARVGQFLLPFGITNRMHPHDWPWTTAPLPIDELIGHGAGSDVGASVQYGVHNPWDKALTLQGAVLSGRRFDPDGETAMPGWLGRAEYFDDFGSFELGVGVSAMGLAQDHLDGADLMLRWKKDSWRSVVLMVEGLRLVEEGEAGPAGYTATLQVQPTRPLYMGVRVDGLDDEGRYAAFVSYYTSEFLRLRAGATTDLEGTWLATGQLTFVWGSHPVEPYWVNR